MSMSIAVEKVEKGDKIEVPFDDSVTAATVTYVYEAGNLRTFELCDNGVYFTRSMDRAETVNLIC